MPGSLTQGLKEFFILLFRHPWGREASRKHVRKVVLSFVCLSVCLF